MKIKKNKLNTTLMRNIDYWAGIPLCFVLSMHKKILQIANFSKRHDDEPKKILLIKPSEMGAIILSYPLMNKIKKTMPNSQLFFLTFKSNEKVFDILNIIPKENIFTIRENSFFGFILDFFSIIKKIRNEKFDITIDLEFYSRFSSIISHLSGAQKKAGFYRYSLEGLYRGDILTHRIQFNPHLHIADSFLSFFEIINLKKKDTPELVEMMNNENKNLPIFIPSNNETDLLFKKLTARGFNKLNKIFLINPGEGTLPLREWPLQNFITLSKEILRNQENQLILVGTSKNSEKSRQLFESVNDTRCIDMSGETTIMELLTLFSISEYLIINDCGLAHLASLTKIRQIVLFGPETPKIFAPLSNSSNIIYKGLPCSPCLSPYNHRMSYCKNNECLKNISINEVVNILKLTFVI